MVVNNSSLILVLSSGSSFSENVGNLSKCCFSILSSQKSNNKRATVIICRNVNDDNSIQNVFLEYLIADIFGGSGGGVVYVCVCVCVYVCVCVCCCVLFCVFV